MDDYAGLIKLGIIVALVLVIGLALRFMGFRYKAKPNKNAKGKKSKGGKKSRGKGDDDIYYKQDAYIDDGEDDTQWNDDDMYISDIGKSGKKKSKDGDQLESWEDY